MDAHACRVLFLFLPWVSGMELRSQGFNGKHAYLQSFHQPSSTFETVILTESRGPAVQWTPGLSAS